MSFVEYSSNLLKSLRLVKERQRVENHDLLLMYPFLIKLSNYVDKLLISSVIKAGIALLLFLFLEARN